jgi:hypothetical protein
MPELAKEILADRYRDAAARRLAKSVSRDRPEPSPGVRDQGNQGERGVVRPFRGHDLPREGALLDPEADFDDFPKVAGPL